MTAQSLRYAEIVGDPVDKLLSPIVHNFWIEALGLDAEYRRLKVERGELAAYLDQRRGDTQWRGCNLAMPLKLDAISLADRISDRAIGTGAANILLPKDGELLAGNTDVAAVMTVLQRLYESGAKFDLVHLLGSGGAARAALMALHLHGVSNVRIHSRDRADAIKLAVQFGLEQEPKDMFDPIDGNGLINATPLGMAGSPPLNVDVSGLSKDGWVLDFITLPNPTALLQRSAQRGLTTVDGIDILVEQAADSFQHFFDAEAPRERDDELLRKLRQ